MKFIVDGVKKFIIVTPLYNHVLVIFYTSKIAGILKAEINIITITSRMNEEGTNYG